MKKVLGLSLVAAIALATNVSAEDAKLTVSSSAALTSNYIWRGISYTDGTSTAQMGIDLDNLANVSGLHLNLWGSGIQEGSEIDTIIGYSTKASGYDLDFSIINYYYTQDTVAGTFAGASYAEAYVNVSRGDYSVAVYKEIGYGNSSNYDGLTFIANANVSKIELSAGTRVGLTSNTSTLFGSIGTSWDCLLIPGYTMGAMLAYNDGFTTTQSLLGADGATFALTLSKDF